MLRPLSSDRACVARKFYLCESPGRCSFQKRICIICPRSKRGGGGRDANTPKLRHFGSFSESFSCASSHSAGDALKIEAVLEPFERLLDGLTLMVELAKTINWKAFSARSRSVSAASAIRNLFASTRRRSAGERSPSASNTISPDTSSAPVAIQNANARANIAAHRKISA